MQIGPYVYIASRMGLSPTEPFVQNAADNFPQDYYDRVGNLATDLYIFPCVNNRVKIRPLLHEWS
jgi:hypothetical protein